MRADLEHLKTAAVYPGHPVTIGYLITLLYPSYEAAVESVYGRDDGRYISTHACCNNDIPGAGGNVHSGERLLQRLRNGEDITDVYAWADEVWRGCDSQATGGHYTEERYPDPVERQRWKDKTIQRWKDGQAQADALKEKLVFRSAWWKQRAQPPAEVGDVLLNTKTGREFVVDGVLVTPYQADAPALRLNPKSPYEYTVSLRALATGASTKLTSRGTLPAYWVPEQLTYPSP